ncbi:MAG TPA: VOC family protein [Candidatus Angelobacter sp.]|jgi:lactoylglutathione lyase|nr:VOC family protein [Candidatus Angelobacter sp.]
MASIRNHSTGNFFLEFPAIGNRVRRKVARLLLVVLTASFLAAQPSHDRPRILGIAHVAMNVSDLGRARLFYENFLGFNEPFSLKNVDGTDSIAFIKINDEQYVELFSERPQYGGHLNHIALYTDDVVRMRDYLVSKGIDILEAIHKGRTGDSFFTVRDPDGHLIEIVQYQPNSWIAQSKGKSTPSTRISNHIMHVGLVVGSVGPAMKFYQEVLGFQETWRGSEDNKQPSWVDMRVPDGTDFVEFMLYRTLPTPAQRKLQNHICFTGADVQQAVDDLKARAGANAYSSPIEIGIGKNLKRQTNLFDPDGARIQIMEATPVGNSQNEGQVGP